MKKFNSGAKLAGTASLLNAALITGSFGLWVHWASAMFSTAAQTVIRFALAALILIALSVYQRLAHPIYRITGKVPWLYIPRRVIGLVVLLGVGTFGLGMLYTSAVHASKVARTSPSTASSEEKNQEVKLQQSSFTSVKFSW